MADAGGAVGTAMAGASAAALMGRKLGEVPSWHATTLAGTAMPTSLRPVKEQAGRFLQKAQPWRDFFIPLASPNANEACSRITANVYHFQTNYAILFVVYLALNILLQPSALFSIAAIVVVWMLFLKKNDDPEWHPTVGGMQL